MASYNVLVVDDNDAHRKLYASVVERLSLNCYKADCPKAAFEVLKEVEVNLVISDMRMPGMSGIEFLKNAREKKYDMPFLLVTAYPAIKDAVVALKLGAVDYLEKPVDLMELETVIKETLKLNTETVAEGLLNSDLSQQYGIVTENQYMKQIINDCLPVAKSDITTLLIGESGTGKEVFASFIHKMSLREGKAFVAVNCASIPAELLGSELFGHVKGAFTGAIKDRAGRFKEADEGTLFLDEIGDMPLELQASLLRVLEVGKITPVGKDKEQSVNVRIIAATNKNLEEAVKEGTFREDLYYRLNVITFELPPLRDRTDDVIPLARFFLRKNGVNKRLSPAASSALVSYSWPGNIRELANAMERAKILATGDIILPEHLPPNIRNMKDRVPTHTVEGNTMEDAEKLAIIQALQANEGNRTKAAETLKISRRSLIYKIKKYGITI